MPVGGDNPLGLASVRHRFQLIDDLELLEIVGGAPVEVTTFSSNA